MKFYLNNKKITKKEAMTYITESQLEEAKQEWLQDPCIEVSWWVGNGMLVVEF